jgi:hypothetical protein
MSLPAPRALNRTDQRPRVAVTDSPISHRQSFLGRPRLVSSFTIAEAAPLIGSRPFLSEQRAFRTAAAQHPATSSRCLRSSGDRAAYWIKFQRGALRCWRRIVLNLWWHAYIRAAQVGWDSNVVVAMRLMRLVVGGALAQREAQRMVAEKVTVLAEAQTAAAAKMITGRGMAAATKSASAVYRRKVRANQRRLARR